MRCDVLIAEIFQAVDLTWGFKIRNRRGRILAGSDNPMSSKATAEEEAVLVSPGAKVYIK